MLVDLFHLLLLPITEMSLEKVIVVLVIFLIDLDLVLIKEGTYPRTLSYSAFLYTSLFQAPRETRKGRECEGTKTRGEWGREKEGKKRSL